MRVYFRGKVFLLDSLLYIFFINIFFFEYVMYFKYIKGYKGIILNNKK